MSELRAIYGVDEGDRVRDENDATLHGILVSVHDTLREWGVTTCDVQWDSRPDGELETRWTSGLVVEDHGLAA